MEVRLMNEKVLSKSPRWDLHCKGAITQIYGIRFNRVFIDV